MKKGARSISQRQRYGSGYQDPDPDPHQNGTDPQHWKTATNLEILRIGGISRTNQKPSPSDRA